MTSGLCECGCGQRTKLAPFSDKRKGHVKGQPFRFIHGHTGNTSGGRPLGTPAYEVDITSGCWNWLRHKMPSGYGQTWRDGQVVLAHRAYYEDEFGPLPEGFDAHHRCGNKSCVNPAHLEPVEHAEHKRQHVAAKRIGGQR